MAARRVGQGRGGAWSENKTCVFRLRKKIGLDANAVRDWAGEGREGEGCMRVMKTRVSRHKNYRESVPKRKRTGLGPQIID